MTKLNTIALEERIAALESQIADLHGLSSIKNLLDVQRADRERAARTDRLREILALPSSDAKYQAIANASDLDRRTLVEMARSEAVMLVADAPGDLRIVMQGMLLTSEHSLMVDVELLARAGELPRYARVYVAPAHAARAYRWTPQPIEVTKPVVEELRAHGFGDRLACSDFGVWTFEPHPWAAGERAHTWTVPAIAAYRKIYPALADAIDKNELAVDALDDEGNRMQHMDVLRERVIQSQAASRRFGYGSGTK